MLSFPPEFPFVRRPVEPEPAPVAAEPPPVELATEPEPAPMPEPQVEAAMAMEPEPEPAPLPMTLPVPKPQPPRLIERRKFRRDGMAAHGLVRMDSSHGPPAKVTLMDISVAGIRFRCNQPMDIGDKGQIRLEVGPLRWTTRLRVVHCDRDEQATHTIGCAFLRTELLKPWPATAA